MKTYIDINHNMETTTTEEITAATSIFVGFASIENGKLKAVIIKENDKSSQTIYYFNKIEDIENMRDLLTGILQALDLHLEKGE